MRHLIVRASQLNSTPESDDPKAKPGKRPGPEKLQRLTQQRDQLYEEARDNPDSEAGEMVRTLLMSGILSAQEGPEASEEDESLRRSWDEDRREQERLRGRAVEAAGAAVRHDRAGAMKADSRIREVQSRMAEVARVAAEAAARPTMDATAVYSRIAEIIGLQPPAAPARTEPKEPETDELAR